MSYAAYSKTQNTSENAKDIEYRLLGQVTAALKNADEQKTAKLIAESALWNRDVWAAFRLDLTHDQNSLPGDLKSQLVDLSYWVERETRDVLNEKSDLQALIEVNRNIMEGLRPKGQADAAAE